MGITDISSRQDNENELRDKTTKYELKDEIDALLRYLETHGDVEDDHLPR